MWKQNPNGDESYDNHMREWKKRGKHWGRTLERPTETVEIWKLSLILSELGNLSPGCLSFTTMYKITLILNNWWFNVPPNKQSILIPKQPSTLPLYFLLTFLRGSLFHHICKEDLLLSLYIFWERIIAWITSIILFLDATLSFSHIN